MYPPQLAWLYDNGPEPYNYRNQKEKIDWINAGIHQLNYVNSVPNYPRFHTYGVRTATRRSIDTFGQEHHCKVKSHRREHWQEAEPSVMLNLRNDRRFIMGKALNKYFVLRT